MKDHLSVLIEGFQRKYPSLQIEIWNTHEDHIHLQMIIPPNIPVSDAVKHFKTFTSRHLKKEFHFIRNMYLEKDGIWSVGYFSSTLGLNDQMVKAYIENQEKKDVPEQQSFLEKLDL